MQPIPKNVPDCFIEEVPKFQRILKMITIFIPLGLAFICCASSKEYVKPGVDFNKYNRIAVLPLTDFSTHPGSGNQVSDILAFSLLKYGIDVIDRSQTINILNEQNLGLYGILDASTAPNVGKLLGVRCIITGSINEWSSTIVNIQMVQGADPAYMPISAAGFSLKLIDCETGEIVWATSARGSTTGNEMQAVAAQRAADKVAGQLAKRLK